jgi:ribonuclease T
MAAQIRGADMTQLAPITFATRFRGFLPVVIDVETGGFNSQTDALLEIAAVMLEMRTDGTLARGETVRYHVAPFPGANMEPASLAVNGIDPHHPLRPAIQEEDALQRIFKEVRNAIRNADCTRAVLVGHNAFFDLNFLNAAVARTQIKRNPFHPFTSFDTATLGGVAFGQTVLIQARLIPPPTMRNARQTCSASSAISFKMCSTPVAGAWPRWDRWKSNPRGRPPILEIAVLGGYRTGLGEKLLQFPVLVHPDDDVTTTDQFAVDVELRKCRPV